jgi:RNA polymerase sigma factor (sigma-70 family)
MNRQRTHDVQRIGSDPDALEAFYREHAEAVQRFVARRIADPGRAADLTADVFVAAIESAHRYRPGAGSPGAWLFGIARHAVSAEYRRARRERGAPAISGRGLLDDGDMADIVARIDAAAGARALYAALAHLPEPERAVLELVAVDELPVSKAADALGIRAVTARVRLHRARRRMQQQLGAEPTTRPAEATP